MVQNATLFNLHQFVENRAGKASNFKGENFVGIFRVCIGAKQLSGPDDPLLTSGPDRTLPTRIDLSVNGFGAMDRRSPLLHALTGGGRVSPPLEAPQWYEQSWRTVFDGELSTKKIALLLRLDTEADYQRLRAECPFCCVVDIGLGVYFVGDYKPASTEPNAFTLSSFIGTHVHGKNTHFTKFYMSNLKDVSFEDATWRVGSRTLCIHQCHIYGAKFLVSTASSITYCDASVAYRYVCDIEVSSKENFARATRAQYGEGESSGSTPTVKDFLAGKREELLHVPGQNLASNLSQGVAPNVPLLKGMTGVVMLNGRLTAKGSVRKCGITGWTVEKSRCTEVPLERSTFEALRVGPAAPSHVWESWALEQDDEDDEDEDEDEDEDYDDEEHVTPCVEFARFFMFESLYSNLCCCCRSNVYGFERLGVNRSGRWMFSQFAQNGLREHGARFDSIKFYAVGNDDKTPTPETPFTGFELEVERGPKAGNKSVTISHILKDEMFMTKHDGSLEDGYEIVSQPFSYAWWLENRDGKIKSMLEYLQKHGIISHDSGRAGLHVHISRPAFTNLTVRKSNGGTFTGSLHLARFSRMVYDNPQWAVWMSRRHAENPNYARVVPEAEMNNYTLKSIATHQSPLDRYVAVNLGNRNTVELRMFRGTLNFKSFCYSIEFPYALWEYTKNTTSPCTVLDFADWVNKTYLGWDKSGPVLKYPFLSGLFKNKFNELMLSVGWKLNKKTGAYEFVGKPQYKFRDEGYVIPPEKLAKMKKAGVEVEA